MFSLLCFHFKFVFACVSFLGNVLPYRDLCSFFLVVFLFRDVGFRFGLCISVSCFCCGHPVFGEKLLLHRGFGKFGKSLYNYGFQFFFNLSVSGLTCKCNLWRVEEWVVLYSRNFKIQRRDGNENVNKTNRFSGQKVLDTFLCNFFGGFARLGRENSLFYFLRRT